MKIAIIEDEHNAAESLKQCILQYEKEFGKQFSIDIFYDAEQFLEDFKKDYSIIFTDIDMPKINGLDVARGIRKQDNQVTLVFVTNLSQYAIYGYEVDAIDYILKPLTYDQFKIKMMRIIRHSKISEKEETIMVSTANGKIAIPLSDLIYIESDDHLLTYHMKNSSIDSFGTMKNLERNLPDTFFRCNTCYIVNLKQVSGIEKTEVILKGDIRLSVSRARRKEFLAALHNFFIQGGY